jgi:hypothetical protein
VNGVHLIDLYLKRADAPVGPALPLYPSQESLIEEREELEAHVDVVERLAIALSAVATPEAVVHAPLLEPAVAWALYFHSVALHLVAEDLLASCRSIIESVTDLSAFQADASRVEDQPYAP